MSNAVITAQDTDFRPGRDSDRATLPCDDEVDLPVRAGTTLKVHP